MARPLSPERNDAFAMGDQTPDAGVRTYGDVYKETQLNREMDNTKQVGFGTKPCGNPSTMLHICPTRDLHTCFKHCQWHVHIDKEAVVVVLFICVVD